MIKEMHIGGQVVLIDWADYDLVKDIKWGIQARGGLKYVVSSKGSMHRVILGLSKGDGKVTDHINHNGLDNRRENLRICTASENVRNRRISLSKWASKYKGVTYDRSTKRTKPWKAVCSITNRNVSIGWYASETEAAQAYNEFTKVSYGEFAYPNTLTQSKEGGE